MRAAIFIDGAYLQMQMKNNGVDADYPFLADHLLAPLRESFPLDLARCYYYYAAPYMSAEPTEDELKRMEVHKQFVNELQSIGRWAVRLGKLQKRWEGQREVYEQKRVDVLLSVDIVRHAAAGHIQHAILVAGDSDFVPAVEAAKEYGVTVSLWCGTAKTVHKDLIAQADEVYAFDWETFPTLTGNHGGGAGGGRSDGEPAKKKSRSRRRRRSGSNRSVGGQGEASAPEPQPDQGGKGGWRDRFRRLAGGSD